MEKGERVDMVCVSSPAPLPHLTMMMRRRRSCLNSEEILDHS
jgi:hypothetical protein